MWWIAIAALPVALMWLVHDQDPVDFRGREVRRAVAERAAAQVAATRRMTRARRRLAWAAHVQAAAGALTGSRTAAWHGRRVAHGLAAAR